MLRNLFLLALFITRFQATAWAQGENSNWCFSAGVRVSFQNGTVTAMGQSSIQAFEAAATVSDAQGSLLFYTDGASIWDRTNVPMPNGTGLHGHTSSRQGVLIVRRPGSSTHYYVFTTDAAENSLRNGLQYSEVDMALHSGLGDVTATKNVRLPAPLLTSTVDEGVIGVQHANRRDVWVLAREYQGTGQLSAFLVTPAGVSAVPVTSPFVAAPLANGTFRVSPNGEQLVMVPPFNPLQLYDFSAATGRGSNPRIIASAPGMVSYGVEFSPDASKLYVSRLNSSVPALYQYDLLAGTPADIQRSEFLVPPISGLTIGGLVSSLETGPDNRLYYSASNFTMGIVFQPNLLGAACRYQAQALPVRNNGFGSDGGIQNLVRQLLPPHFAPLRACAGQATAFTAQIPSPDPGTTVSWNFGDPAAGAANTAAGTSAAHTFAAPGTYLVTLRTSWSGGGQAAVTDTVVVSPMPVARFAARSRRTCAGTAVRLRLNAQPPGTRYRWSDNSTDSILVVQVPGTYWAEVTTGQGCTARDTVRVQVVAAPVLALRADTTLCPGQPVHLRPNAQPAGTTYRWADGSTAPEYTVVTAGTYRLHITNAQGCTAMDSVEVRPGNCPVVIPNIITPDGDGQNDSFVLRGLDASFWRLEVYNRWGIRIYQAAPYDNGWRAQGQSGGTYYYLLTNSVTGQRHRGWVEVVKN